MCDLVVASENAVFKYPEAQLGFTGGLIGSAVARIPHKIAMEFMLLGENFNAQKALSTGMINKIAPSGKEYEAALEWATILSNSAPLVVQSLKDFSMQTLNKSPAEIGALSRERLLTIRQSGDGREGAQAFSEKRTPKFKGH